MDVEDGYKVGDHVTAYVWQTDRTMIGVIVEVKGCYYRVEFDDHDASAWFREDRVELCPTPEQIKQFSALIDRVLSRVRTNELKETNNG